MDLRRGSQAAVDAIIKHLEANKRVITTSEEIAQVATISANGDKHVGSMIAQAMEKVGKEGVITVKEGKTIEDEIEITEGMRFDRGFISPYFITDVKTQKTEFEKPLILLSEKKISLIQDILPSLEAAAQARRPLLIIAEDIDGEALAACILNKLRGQLQVAAVKAPGFGDNRKSILGDLAILTGSTVFTDELDIKLEKATPDLLGSTGSVTITKEDTIILNGAGEKSMIQDRCEQIRSAMSDATTSDYDRTKLQERLAKLSGGVAVIKVGGSSEVEVGEKKDRFDDALNATRAAVEEGIVPGGGTALLKASQILKDVPTANFDQRLGVDLIRSAITKPIRTIVTNAGEEGSVVVGRILERYADKFNWGYDASTGEYCVSFSVCFFPRRGRRLTLSLSLLQQDMIERGILEYVSCPSRSFHALSPSSPLRRTLADLSLPPPHSPYKVVKTSLVDASGVSSLLFTSECCIVDAPEDKGPGGPPGGGMGGVSFSVLSSLSEQVS
jgi:chaperonin GroEL